MTAHPKLLTINSGTGPPQILPQAAHTRLRGSGVSSNFTESGNVYCCWSSYVKHIYRLLIQIFCKFIHMTFEFLSMVQSPYVIHIGVHETAQNYTFLKFVLLWYGIDFFVIIMHWPKDKPHDCMQMNLDALIFLRWWRICLRCFILVYEVLSRCFQ